MSGNGFLSRRKLVADEFPKTLEGFGYRFNEKGQLRQIENPEAGYVFEVKSGDKNYNQKRYEALGEILTEEVYKLLETAVGLKKIHIPVDASNDEVRGFFYASDDAFTNEKLMVLIHGSGVVRAGQWARKLLINDDIDSGTQIPYIKHALETGYGVIVLNTNQNRITKPDGEEDYIRGSEDPISHALYVWDNFIRNAAARHIAIVAHSAGGYVTVNLAHERSDEFKARVFAVAYTDSAHSAKSSSPSWDHMLLIARNWVTSNAPVGTAEKRRLNDVDRVSAGTTSHERTSSSAIADIQRFIQYRYDLATKKPQSEADDIEDSAEDEIAMETQSEVTAPVPVNENGEDPAAAEPEHIDDPAPAHSVPGQDGDGDHLPTVTSKAPVMNAQKTEHESSNGFQGVTEGPAKTEL